MAKENFKPGKMSISRTHCSRRDDYVHITISDEKSGIQFIDLRMDFEPFAEMLLGLSCQPCKFELYGVDNIGERKEIKHENVLIFTGATSYDRRVSIAEYEVDGWIGRDLDASNSHRRVQGMSSDKGIWTSISFHRFVEEKE